MARETGSEPTRIVLDVATPYTTDPKKTRVLPWFVATILGVVVAAVFGWIVPTAVAALAWFDISEGPFTEVFSSGVIFWLLGHGYGANLDDIPLTIIPLGLSIIFFGICVLLGSFAARQARIEAPDELSQRERRNLTLKISSVFGIIYLSVLTFGAVFLTQPIGSVGPTIGRLLVGGSIIGFGGAWLGASRVFGFKFATWLPDWMKPLPKALIAAQLIMIISGALALLTAITMGRSRIELIHNSLEMSGVGGFVLLLIQLAWLPNLVIWASSWVIGAGFSIGVETIISPTKLSVGLMPGFPILGAVPTQVNPGNMSLWMISGAIAGMVVALAVLKDRPTIKLDESSLVGGLSGVVSGLIFTAIVAVSGGDMGVNRMVNLGGKFPDVAVMAIVVMGFAGLITGLVVGLIRRPKKTPKKQASKVEEEVAEVIEDGQDDQNGATDTETSSTVE